MDVKSTFLNGELEEEVCIEKPEGYPLKDDKDIVCKLRKELYGLKQEPKTQYAKLDKHLENLKYRSGMGDNNLSWKEIDDGLMILVIFVDDIILGGNDEERKKKLRRNEERIWNEYDRRNEIFPRITDSTK